MNRFLTLIFSAVLILSTYAQENNPQIKSYTIKDSIVVVGNRYSLPLKTIPYSLQVIPEKDVKYFSTFSALELVDIFSPSAFVIDKRLVGYGVGSAGAGSFNIRGIGGQPNSSVLVLINGHPDFMGLFGHPLPDVYSSDHVKSVEIISGPSSTVFGSNAMGGVVNIVTSSEYDHPLSIGIEGGSFGTFIGKFSLSNRFGKHGLFFSSNNVSSNGHIPETSFKSQNYQAGYDYFASPVWQLSIKGSYVPYSFDDPSRGSVNPSFGTYGIIKRGNGSIILSNNDLDWKGSFQLYGNMGYHRFYDNFYSHDFSYGASVYQQYKSNDQLSLAIGSDFLYYGGKANSDNELHKINSIGVYALALYSPIINLSFRGGLRLQYSSISITNFSPVLGVTFSPLINLELYANYQNGFRLPTIQELYLFPISNPNLKDEKVNGYEFGAKVYSPNNSFIKLAYFQSNVDNLIQLDIGPARDFGYFNSGSDKIWGIESEAHLVITPNLSTTLGYGHLEPGYLTAFNPNHQLKYIITWQKEFYQISLFGKYISGLNAFNKFDPIGIKNPPFYNEYNLLNLYSGIQFSRFTLTVKLNNLLNKSYYYLPGFKAPGISVLTGIEYAL